ncbi:PD-(D/E)XK nuclease family protein [Clostridium sp. YIM B02505]|uniref:PD-(D/E)XK nuclease family protein n=1 Tax=Clostridium yunnanense TaxID=2800325 RepID=A0ABS1ERL7_9CLOT|nr:PD-(D/E)XK nuclease family protein [Clostridium yunnanense]MBK1811953.1 PD-(D/E)XK nuclease family protein [Clostridium yunnanense]
MDIKKLREIFEDNYEELKYETGRSITLNMKEFAWQQVKLYYEKLGSVAKNMTEAEVKLILPEQVTPKGKKYTMEGIVDIVEKDDEITMYDIKTHNSEEVENDKDVYKGQLNVYAHMWKNLKGTEIDKMAVIATALPTKLRQATTIGDEIAVDIVEDWNPVVELDIDSNEVEKQIRCFGETVDKIEDGEFKAPTLDRLKEIKKGQKAPFGTAVCRHCDARHSCDSYSQYINKVKLDEEILESVQSEDMVEQDEWKDAFMK